MRYVAAQNYKACGAHLLGEHFLIDIVSRAQNDRLDVVKIKIFANIVKIARV